MFLVDIGGMKALYTGDYSRVTDRHLSAADMPPVTPHIGEGVAVVGAAGLPGVTIESRRGVPVIHSRYSNASLPPSNSLQLLA